MGGRGNGKGYTSDPGLHFAPPPPPKRLCRRVSANLDLTGGTQFDADICAYRIKQKVPGRIFSHFHPTTHTEYTRPDIHKTALPRPTPVRITKRDGGHLEPQPNAPPALRDSRVSLPPPPLWGGGVGAASGPSDAAAPAVLPPVGAPSSLMMRWASNLEATARATCSFVLQRVRSATASGSGEGVT